MTTKTKHIIFLSALFLLFILPRIFVFYADPDISLTWSGTFLTDEIYHNGNAIKEILSGQWWLNDYNYIVMDPVIPFLQWALFKIGNVSLLNARLPSFLLSLALIYFFSIFIYLRADKHGLPKAGMALFLLSSNYFLMIYGKMALLDIPMTTFATAGLLSFSAALRKKDNFVRSLSGSVFLMLALLTKASAANFLLALGLSFLIFYKQKKISARALFNWTGLLLVVVAAYFLILTFLHGWIPNTQLAARGNALIGEKLPKDFWQILKYYATSPGNSFVRLNSPLFILVFYVIYKQLRSKHWNDTATMMAMLMVSTFLFHGFFNYHPPRYYMVLSVPMVYFIVQFPEVLSISFPGKPNKASLSGFMLILLVNGWNFQKSIDYSLHPQYTFIQTAKAVDRAIRSTGALPQQSLLLDADVHTSMPYYLNMDFDYGYKMPANNKPVFLISSKQKAGNHFLGRFSLYGGAGFYLYRLR